MLKRVLVAVASVACAAGLGLATPAHADPIQGECPIDSECGQPGDPGGGGYGQPPTYELQGVIEKQGTNSEGPLRSLDIRGYSRFADAGNNRVDADYIRVSCTASAYGFGSTTDSDHESNGALVDVHFNTPVVPYGTQITVNCIHHAENNGITYDKTSTATFFAPLH